MDRQQYRYTEKGRFFKQLSDGNKSIILYYAIPHYYIKKMKEGNTDPIKTSLEELFQFALNIGEAAINPGNNFEGNARSRKEKKSETTIPRKQEGRKGKVIRNRSGGKSSILKFQYRPSCDVCSRQGHTESACRI
jgi:hypothetical protein